ncbi:MAG: double-cubane-cluster-containing anaerobic reductase [Syntrophobacteraceae bacterium]
MRPNSFKHFENMGERFQLEVSEQQDKGIKVSGIYCLFASVELVRACGAIPVSLCGKKEKPIAFAERILPANLCPLIKSSYGYAITDTCPYFAASDFIIGETTCDGKKKMFELLGRIKPLHLMHLPYSSTDEGALRFWYSELSRLQSFLEEQTGRKSKEEDLRRQIKLHNKMRTLLSRISRFEASECIPMTGIDMMTVMEAKSFFVYPEPYIDLLEEFIAEMEEIAAGGVSPFAPDTPRILLTGCPAGKGSEKVLFLIEECGGAVVCQENCTGVKGLDLMVDEEEKDPLLALARRYLQIPCSCITPNAGRLEFLDRLISEYKIDGVVDLTWQCCHTYNIESRVVGESVENVHGLPFLHVETDYSSADIEQLRTRIEAFLEMVRWQSAARAV